MHDEAGAELLTDKRRPLDSWMIEFKLFVILHEQADFTDDGDWHLKPTRVGFRTGQPHSDIFTVRDRLIGTLPVAFDKLQPEMMLKTRLPVLRQATHRSGVYGTMDRPRMCRHCGGNYAVRREPRSVSRNRKPCTVAKAVQGGGRHHRGADHHLQQQSPR